MVAFGHGKGREEGAAGHDEVKGGMKKRRQNSKLAENKQDCVLTRGDSLSLLVLAKYLLCGVKITPDSKRRLRFKSRAFSSPVLDTPAPVLFRYPPTNSPASRAVYELRVSWNLEPLGAVVALEVHEDASP